MVEYFYHTALGKAVLNIEGKPLKHLGKFKTEAQARQACDAHFAKACKAADNFRHGKMPAIDFSDALRVIWNDYSEIAA